MRLLSSDERLPAVKRNQGLHEADGDLSSSSTTTCGSSPDALAEHACTHAAHRSRWRWSGYVRAVAAQMPPTPFIEWYRPFAYDGIADRADRPVPYSSTGR